MWEPVALCCFSRRTGCLVFGSVEVIAAVLGLVIGVFHLAGIELSDSFLQAHHGNTRDGYEERIKLAVNSAVAIVMVCGTVQLICASMMIHGVRKNDHCLMCPFLIKNLIAVVLHIISAGITVPYICIMINFALGILAAYCYGALVFMWTYLLLTVRAYYFEVKRGKADDHHRLVENSEVVIDAVHNL